ncbi:MAG: BBP7 family outer membrane beta-barrel protein [Gemmataceae bacterium]|nr:BBP7 family outer membrane beta-barrel protein [Gemmataceae bacterium]
MRRFLAGGLGLALGLNGLATAGNPEVIASSSEAPAATLGTPRPGAVIARGKAQEPANTPVPSAPLTVPPPATPLHAPMPSGPSPAPIASSTGAPPLPPGAIPMGPPKPAGPATNYVPGAIAAPVDPGYGVAPLGPFSQPTPLNQQRWYVGAEYLYWWTRDGALPPLVTGGNFNDFIPGSLSPITGPNSFITYGNGPLDTQGRSGGRFTVGRWFGDCMPWAIEFSGFFVGNRTASFSDSASDGRVIARPFYESNRNRPSAELVAASALNGSINVGSTSSFYGANLDWRRRLWCPELCGGKCGPRAFRLDGTVGFRYLNLDEDLSINEQSVITQNVFSDILAPNGTPYIIPAGVGSQVSDNFRVDNDFYGGSLGLIANYNLGRWSLGMGTKISLGVTRERLEISGSQTITYPVPPGGTFNFPGGLLARPSNIGTYTQNTFAVVPEVNFNVGYQFTNHFKMFVGYDFLYWSKVLRAGDQIDTTVNLAGIPYAPQPGQRDADGNVIPAGANRPTVLLRETDFWAQGISLGMLWTW